MKKITLSMLLLIGVLGFSQERSIKELGEKNLQSQRNQDSQSVSNRSSGAIENAFMYGYDNPTIYGKSTAVNTTAIFPIDQRTSEAEILASRTYLENNAVVSSPFYGANRPMADIIPIAGAIESFTPTVGDNFFDPGGPGGSTVEGTPGNYPNCACATQTTLLGVSEINFLYFSVFSNFDYLRIYDGTDATGAVLYDNGLAGANEGDKTLADMIASNGSSTFTAASGDMFFYFYATAVVDYGGWDAEIVAVGGGGGGAGVPCSTTSPSNSFENGKSFTKNLGRIVAHDITVAADEDFVLEDITFNSFIGSPGSGVNAANVDLLIYADSGGAPGALLSSQLALVPASQTVIGDNFGYQAWSIVLDITDVNMPGQAGVATTYWVGLSLEPTDGSNTFWENTTAAVVGLGLAYNDGTGFIIESASEGVYTFAGTCSGGGGTTTFPAPYCGPLAFNNGVEPITKVIFAGIDNPSSADTTSPAHEDFTAIEGDVEQGESLSIALEGNTDGSYTNTFTVFIDWNQNGSMDDAGERYDVGSIVNSTGLDGQQATSTIAVPTDALLGNTRMRVIKRFGSSYPTDSCTPGSGYGQAEDYTIVVSAGGGGGNDCGEENPNDFTFENGFNCSSASAFQAANDLTVAVGEDFTLTNITASIFANAGITNVDVIYYDNNAGLPGAIIGSQSSVTIDSQAVIGNNFGFDVNEIELIVDPFVFEGQATAETTYWIELSVTDGGSTGSVFWVVTSSSMIGNPTATLDGVWGYNDPLMDGVYIWDGECTSLSVADNNIEGFSFYPNPTSNILNLSASKNIESVSIFNLLGQKVLSSDVGATSTEVNLSGLAQGTYVMKVASDGQLGTYKVIKN